MAQFFSEYKDVFTGTAAVAGLAIFAFGLYQYRRAEQWKKNEFIAKLFRDMSDDPDCHRAMQMLDWANRKINFGSPGCPNVVTFSLSLLVNGLRTENLNFTDAEMHVRDTFDRYFIFMTLFEAAIKNRLVSEAAVYPYFAYWIELLRGERHLPEPVIKQILEYLQTYGYADVVRFLNRSWPAGEASTMKMSRADKVVEAEVDKLVNSESV